MSAEIGHFRWLDFGIIENDFWSSAIWADEIQVSYTEFENPKIPEFNLDVYNIPYIIYGIWESEVQTLNYFGSL